MDAADAPKTWAEGDHRTVLEYCGSDAKYTTDIFFFGRREGRIMAIGKNEEEEKLQTVKVMW